jgi:hypothetical protein
MAIRAIAFHEAISYEKLEEIFKADENVLFGGSLAGACSKMIRKTQNIWRGSTR